MSKKRLPEEEEFVIPPCLLGHLLGPPLAPQIAHPNPALEELFQRAKDEIAISTRDKTHKEVTHHPHLRRV